MTAGFVADLARLGVCLCIIQLTRTGRKQLRAETENREQRTAMIARFFAVKAEDLK